MEDQIFYVGQKALIKKGGKVLVLVDPFVGLDLPGGKIQEGENDLNKALIREVREETGLKVKSGKPVDRWVFNLRTTHKNAGKQVYLIIFECRYLSGSVKLSDDHNKFHWLDKNSLRKVKEDSEIYNCLKRYFSGALSSVG